MEPEEYNEYGEIKKPTARNLSSDMKHRIHQTKDLFDSNCSLCVLAAKKRVTTYWRDDE